MSKPTHKVKYGNITVSIWENTNNDKTYQTATWQKTYLDQKKEWQNTNTLNKHDIPKLILALQKTYQYMLENPPINTNKE